MPDPRLILIADFDAKRLSSTAALLGSRGYRVLQAGTGPESLEICRNTPPAYAVLDADLPRLSGIEVLKSLKSDARTAVTRVVLVAQAGDQAAEERCRLCGADAVLSRPFIGEDLLGILRALRAMQRSETEELRELEEVLEGIGNQAIEENPVLRAITDRRTGLFNRTYSDMVVAQEFKKARRFGQPLSCILVGLDARLEESAGEEDGRRLLSEIAGILLCESRDIDHIARYREQEFFLVLPHTDAGGATTMARRILASIAGRTFETGDGDLHITASAGVSALAGPPIEGPEEFERRAREALQLSQSWGGNRCTLWEPDRESASA
jgi:diguanylate cyclase (GGDEF)-like protein